MVGGHATVGWLSYNVFWTFQAIWENFEKSRWTVTRQWSEVTRPSADCQTTFFRQFKQLENVLKKSRWTVTRQLSEVSRPSADCLTTFFGRFKQFGKNYWKKSLNGHATVVGGHANVGRLSNNVLQTIQAIRKFFEKKSLNGHAIVVGGHATVGWLSNNVFWTFQAIGNILKKVAERSRDSGWGHATVGRLSYNVFRRFKKLENMLKKVAERSRDSGRRSRDRRLTVIQRFWTFQAIRHFFEKSRWTVTRQWSEVTRPSADCHTTFFERFKRFGNILKKVAERSRDSGRRSRDPRPTVIQRFLTFQAIRHFFEKSRWTVTRQWSEVTQPSDDCQTTFLDVSSN